jgi:hypothetical protein
MKILENETTKINYQKTNLANWVYGDYYYLF